MLETILRKTFFKFVIILKLEEVADKEDLLGSEDKPKTNILLKIIMIILFL